MFCSLCCLPPDLPACLPWACQAIATIQRSFRTRDPVEEMELLGFGEVKLVGSLPVTLTGRGSRGVGGKREEGWAVCLLSCACVLRGGAA